MGSACKRPPIDSFFGRRDGSLGGVTDGSGFPQIAAATNRTDWRTRSGFVVLVALGLFFWIPPLLRATVGDGKEISPVPDEANVDIARDADELSPAAKAAPNGLSLPAASSLPWPKADEIVLTTTILGKTRRAAIVNGRLYREGDRIVIAGDPLRLAAVDEDWIELSREEAKGARPGRGDRRLIVRLKLQRTEAQASSNSSSGHSK